MGEIYQSLKIRGKKTIRLNALIDTGATVSVIKEKHAKRAQLPRTRSTYVFFGGTIKVPATEAVMFVRIRDGEVPASVCIVKDKAIDENLVLGMDFLQNEDVVIDYRIDKVRMLRKRPKKYRL